jgi:hypothetical protein
MIVVPREGEVAQIERIVSQPLTLRLYVNDHVPGPGDTFGDYVEPEGGSYHATVMLPSEWELHIDLPIPEALHDGVAFVFTDTVDPIYGYIVTDARDRVQWAERFDEQADVLISGGVLTPPPALPIPVRARDSITVIARYRLRVDPDPESANRA